jgi:hypothetical protein
MRSTRNAVLVASALASGSLLGMASSSALAQGFGVGSTGGGFSPGSPTRPPAGRSVLAGYPISPSTGMSGMDVPARANDSNSQAVTPPVPRPANPGAEEVRTSYSSRATRPGGPTAMAAPGPVNAQDRPAPSPIVAPGRARSRSEIKPYLASVPSPADAPKPKGIRRIFSYLWHGGSTTEAESKPTQYDYSTGRTDLPNSRPWMTPASSK